MCKTHASRIFEQLWELESKGFQQAYWKFESFWWPWQGKECTKLTIKTHRKLKKSSTCSVLTSSHPKAKQVKTQKYSPFSTPMSFTISIASNDLLSYSTSLSCQNFISWLWQYVHF